MKDSEVAAMLVAVVQDMIVLLRTGEIVSWKQTPWPQEDKGQQADTLETIILPWLAHYSVKYAIKK